MLDTTHQRSIGLGLRRATAGDLENLDRLRRESLRRLMIPSLRASQRTTLDDYTQFDPRLIGDGTYYVLEIDGRIAASGGWSRRGALTPRGSHAAAKARILDPSRDPAAIRAMYTHPDFARQGLGSILLATVESAARLAGFRRAELIATSAGRELYLARGWKEVRRMSLGPEDGSAIEATLMERTLRSPFGQTDSAAASSNRHATDVSGW